jgi:hypothetical protein
MFTEIKFVNFLDSLPTPVINSKPAYAIQAKIPKGGALHV